MLHWSYKTRVISLYIQNNTRKKELTPMVIFQLKMHDIRKLLNDVTPLFHIEF